MKITEYPLAYACYNKDFSIRVKSTSGGVFSVIAKYILQQRQGIVYGAAFDENFGVYHISITTIDELTKLRGSKYPQSNIGMSFKEVKVLLEEDRTVLFTGTPCQIEGLKAYLKKDYENLYCLDFVCHGVASPKVWREYVNELKKKGNIKSITFKSKIKSWKKWYFRVEYDQGIYQMRGALNPFMRSYLEYCNIRPVCFECEFKGIYRNSDFTISDCWGVAESNKVINDDRGLSALLIHNEKAKRIFEYIKEELMYQEYQAFDLMEGNWTTIKSIKPNMIRKEFFGLVCRDGSKRALKVYFEPKFKDWVRYYILCMLGKEK